LVVRQTVGGEKGDFLTTSDGIHHIYGRNTRLYHFLRINTLVRVDGHTLNIEEVLGEHGGTMVDRCTGAVEGTTQHFVGNGHLESRAGELTMSVKIVDARSAFENLNHGALALDLEDLALTGRSI
jgi:hypothetical protein